MTVLKEWNDLPKEFQIDEVKPYYDVLYKKRKSLLIKRLFDIVISSIMLIAISPILIVIAILIDKDSDGGIFYRQERVTQYGKKFRIHKFRTMVANADQIGSAVTTDNDSRVTKIGETLRKYRLDELPQLIDILEGNMSFVGTRPEVTKYVEQYSSEMLATLLLPAGVTSKASIAYKDEAELLDASNDVDKTYIEEVLPQKMKYNLDSLKEFSVITDFLLMVKTVFAVLG